jgi:hypothetical protein
MRRGAALMRSQYEFERSWWQLPRPKPRRREVFEQWDGPMLLGYIGGLCCYVLLAWCLLTAARGMCFPGVC